MSMLLTRPEGQGEEWRSALQDLGATVTHIPSLVIRPLPSPNNLTAMLKAAQLGIFVSTNAVRALAAEPAANEYTISWYGIGQSTRELARSLGFAVAEANAFNSESLLQHSGLQNVAQHNCLIVRGEGGRETLAKTLLARGAEVNYCEMYRRDCASESAGAMADYLQQASQKPLVISASSVDTLNYTLTLAEQGQQAAVVKQATLLVPSERVARAAREHGIQSVLQTPSMQLADIVYILKKWWADQQ